MDVFLPVAPEKGENEAARKAADFLMCSPPFCSMKITQDIRDKVAKMGPDEIARWDMRRPAWRRRARSF